MTTTAPRIATRNFEGLDIPEAGTFAIDASHSAAAFTVRHLVVAKTRGRFTDIAGEIDFADNPLDSSVNVTIGSASVSTGDDVRDDHLRSPDFLDVEQHPTLTFRSTGVRYVNREQFVVDGELTIASVAKPVALEVNYDGSVLDPWGGVRAVFTASTKINREDFGLTWNQALEAGGVLVGKDVVIDIEIEAVRR